MELEATNLDCIKEFRAHFGKLWSALEFTGIEAFDISSQYKLLSHTLLNIRKILFPMLLSCNFVYLLYLAMSENTFGYYTFIDTSLAILPLLMWLHMFNRNTVFKHIWSNTSKIFKKTYVLKQRSLSYPINIALFLVFLYPLALSTVHNYDKLRNETYYFIALKFSQEMIFPSVISVTYCSISFFYTKTLRFYKTRFKNNLDVGCFQFQTHRNLVKAYTDVVKTIEEFQDFFSTLIFFLVWENICIVSLITLDYITLPSWNTQLTLEGSLYLALPCGLLGAVTVSAAEIPLEIRRIRSILLDIMSLAQTDYGFTGTNQQIMLLLNRDPPVLSLCNTLPLDRGFLLKFLAANVAQALIFYQLAQYRAVTSDREETLTGGAK